MTYSLGIEQLDYSVGIVIRIHWAIIYTHASSFVNPFPWWCTGCGQGYLPNTEHRNEHHVSVDFAAQDIMKASAYCAWLNYCFSDTAAKLFEIMFKHSLVHLTEIQYNYCFGRKIAVNFLTNRNCKLFSFLYYPHSYPV